MRSILAGAGLVAVLAAPVVAAPPAPSTGPFLGDVAQGETDSFTYDNHPKSQNCIQLAADYVITVHHVPASDTLTLSVLDESATTTGGAASVIVTQGVCARFGISVSGTSVADSARYVITVTRSLLPPVS